MFSDCIAEPDACLLAQNSPKTTAAELEQEVFTLFDDLSQQPIAIGDLIVRALPDDTKCPLRYQRLAVGFD